MKYKDRIYGEFKIAEPVILELMACPTMERLKEIDQAGYFEPHYPGTAHSRFEHSVGVYLLLRMFGASIHEQIAGLIHDVSHSAFSHCVDYALDEGSEEKQSYQDDVFEKFVRNSEIPGILKKNGFDTDYILDSGNFLLLERDLPGLCADRIDYSLRGAVIYAEVLDAGYFLDYFRVDSMVGGESWFFDNLESAEKFAEIFLKMSSVYYAGLASAIMFRTVGDWLRRALKKKYITHDDLFTTDERVLEKINAHLREDEELEKLFCRMTGKIGCKNSPCDYDRKVTLKSRAVDPLFRDGERVIRLSEAKPAWKDAVNSESKPKEYFLKFEG